MKRPFFLKSVALPKRSKAMATEVLITDSNCNYNWHDSVIEQVTIEKSGYSDSLILRIKWSENETMSILRFDNLYFFEMTSRSFIVPSNNIRYIDFCVADEDVYQRLNIPVGNIKLYLTNIELNSSADRYIVLSEFIILRNCE